MANWRSPGPICSTANAPFGDAGTLSRRASAIPGTLGTIKAQPASYSYSISGTTGILGSMLFAEASDKLPGTLYDRTEATTKMRKDEAALGLTEYFDEDAHKSARRTLANIRNPAPVDVDIYFATRDKVESIMVRGRRGARAFRFDFKEVEKKAEKLPDDVDPFQLILDTIEKILEAVRDLR